MESKISKILICVDGSLQASQIIDYISHFIPPANYSAHLFHVYHKVPHTFWDLEPILREKAEPVKFKAWTNKQKESIRNFLDSALGKINEAGVPKTKTEMHIQERKHNVARDIIIESQKDYDAVVVGRSAQTGMKKWFLGSVSSKLLGHIGHIPLCIVGGNPDTSKVLVAMDNSDSSKKGLNFIASLVKGGEKELLLFNAVRQQNLPAYVLDMPGVKEANLNLMEESRQTMVNLLEETKMRLIEAGVQKNRIRTKVSYGVASRSSAIIEESWTAGYGTIVLGRRGLSNVEEFFIGRVSNKVVQLAGEEAVWVVG